MKNLILIPCLLILFYSANAQKITEYKATDGITYHLGDTVLLGRGSGQNGQFVYMVTSMLNESSTQTDWIKRKLTGSAVIIKKIKQNKYNGVNKTLFYVGIGAMYLLHLDIDNAIEAGEVKRKNQ